MISEYLTKKEEVKLESEVERENKKLRETIRYNACQAEKDSRTIVNLNLKQRETIFKLAKEVRLTDELKWTNKDQREENIREKHKLYVQLDNEEKANEILKNLTVELKKENRLLKNKIEFIESKSKEVSNGTTRG